MLHWLYTPSVYTLLCIIYENLNSEILRELMQKAQNNLHYTHVL